MSGDTIADRIAGAAAILCQAEAILDMAVTYGDEVPQHISDITAGAITVLKAAMRDFGEIEVAVRAADRRRA